MNIHIKTNIKDIC